MFTYAQITLSELTELTLDQFSELRLFAEAITSSIAINDGEVKKSTIELISSVLSNQAISIQDKTSFLSTIVTDSRINMATKTAILHAIALNQSLSEHVKTAIIHDIVINQNLSLKAKTILLHTVAVDQSLSLAFRTSLLQSVLVSQDVDAKTAKAIIQAVIINQQIDTKAVIRLTNELVVNEGISTQMKTQILSLLIVSHTINRVILKDFLDTLEISQTLNVQFQHVFVDALVIAHSISLHFQVNPAIVSMLTANSLVLVGIQATRTIQDQVVVNQGIFGYIRTTAPRQATCTQGRIASVDLIYESTTVNLKSPDADDVDSFKVELIDIQTMAKESIIQFNEVWLSERFYEFTFKLPADCVTQEMYDDLRQFIAISAGQLITLRINYAVGSEDKNVYIITTPIVFTENREKVVKMVFMEDTIYD